MSFFRSKYRYPAEVTGRVIDGNADDGDTSISEETWTVGEVSYIEYWVPGDGPCTHIEVISKPTPWNGVVSRSPCYVWWEGHRYTRVENVHAGLTLVAPSFALRDMRFSTTELLAKTHPGKPKVSVPNYLYELKDLPGMLRGEGFRLLDIRNRRNSWLSKPASAYLSGKFGWGPLLSDTLKMFDFVDSVSQRIKRLEHLYGSRGSSGLVEFGTDEVEITDPDQNMVWGRGDRHTFISQRCWGSVRWKSDNPPQSKDDLILKAFQAAYGLNVSPVTLWNAIPWTWLNDWFFNVGEYLQATSNQLGCYPTDIWRHLEITQVSRDVNVRPHSGLCPSEDHMNAASGHVTKTAYYRLPAPPATIDFAGVPFLTEDHIATAAALLAQRHRS
jgi:hypothetical protein